MSPRPAERRTSALALLLGLLAASACAQCRSSHKPISVPGAQRELTFNGMCDASGAVPLSSKLFAVADDEGNQLRVYDADRGGDPVDSIDLSEVLHLPRKVKKKSGKLGKAPETDLEAATRIGDLAFWLTSHARNSSGKLKTERHRFFATRIPRDGGRMELAGQVYEGLFDDLIADPRFARFGLEQAAELAPKAPGGLNIEGMTERPEGGVLIGFRNPIPEGKALLVPLLDPERIIAGEHARFGDAITLDLGGLGVRSLSYWHGRYLIAAGHYDEGAPSQLYTWDGKGAPQRVAKLDFSAFNPEGFFTPEERSEILVVSDDGSVEISGEACKKLNDPEQKRFRGVWLKLR